MKITSLDLPEENFEAVLQKVLLNPDSMFELIGHSEFLTRGYLICCKHARGGEPQELFNDAVLKALIFRHKLRAENTPNKEAFFGWFSQIALNAQRDLWRKSKRDYVRLSPLTVYDEESATEEEREIADRRVGPDGDLLLKEFLEFTKTLPVKYRHAIILRLRNYPDKGCPYEQIARELHGRGYECTAPTVRSWVRASLTAFLNGGHVAHDSGQVGHKKKAG